MKNSKAILNTNKKTALLVEGGGLRGAYAVGVLRKLYEYGGPDQFDAIYAVSSGVFAASYFAAEQVEDMENTWRDRVHGSRLISFWRVVKGQPILGLDYLIDLFKGAVHLSLDKVFNSRPTIKYILTEYETGIPHYLNAKRPEIFDLMRASAALPCVYTKPIYIDNIRYFDGGHSDPVPIKKVIDDGYTEILAVLTRPKGYDKPPASNLIAKLCLNGSPAAMKVFLNLHEHYNNSMRIIENPGTSVNIVTVRPERLKISRLTRNREIIIGAIEQGKNDAEKIFSKLAVEKRSADIKVQNV